MVLYSTFKDKLLDLPGGLGLFYFPSLLSAGLFGGSTANKKITTLCELCASAVKKIMLITTTDMFKNA
jgi:hypothetical protein